MIDLTEYDPEHCYLGPESFPQFVLKLLPYWRLYNYSAHLHDRFFREGGGIKEMLQANRIFSVMVRGAGNTLCERFFGSVYVLLVNLFSHLFFNFKQKPYNYER